MPWDDDLIALIREHWQVDEEFTLAQIYAHESYFAKRHPQATNVKASLRRSLQTLRNFGAVEFVDRSGRYRRLK